MILMASGGRDLSKAFQLIFTVMFLLLSSEVLSSEVLEQGILKRLEGINTESLSLFVDEMEALGALSQQLIEKKTQTCSAEIFSTIIDTKGDSVLQKKKLTRQEKRLCLSAIIEFRVRFTKGSFLARKKHLRNLHTQQVLDLEQLEKRRVLALEKLLKKYR